MCWLAMHVLAALTHLVTRDISFHLRGQRQSIRGSARVRDDRVTARPRRVRNQHHELRALQVPQFRLYAFTFKIGHPDRLFFFAGEEEPSRRTPAAPRGVDFPPGVGVLRLPELPQAEAQLRSA